jgi:hypothetical protein
MHFISGRNLIESVKGIKAHRRNKKIGKCCYGLINSYTEWIYGWLWFNHSKALNTILIYSRYKDKSKKTEGSI